MLYKEPTEQGIVTSRIQKKENDYILSLDYEDGHNEKFIGNEFSWYPLYEEKILPCRCIGSTFIQSIAFAHTLGMPEGEFRDSMMHNINELQ